MQTITLNLLIDKYKQEMKDSNSYIRYEVLRMVVEDLERLKDESNSI